MKPQATAIICAYNEENTITNILREVCELNYFNEVIVINDGSTDKTGKLIREFKKTFNVNDIHLLKNKGKGFAMAIGSKMACTEYLVFIDADVSNFTLTHAKELLNPLQTGKADMVLGQATNTLINPNINPFKDLSGQRALKKRDIKPILKKMETARYGVETLINMQIRANNQKIFYIFLENLVHPTKFQKTKPHKAIKEFILEGFQIVTTMLSNLNMPAKSNRNRMPNIFSINI